MVEAARRHDGDDEGADAEEVEADVEADAEALLSRVEEALPDPFIHQRFTGTSSVGTPTHTLLSRATDHRFTSESIRDRVDASPALLEGLDAEAAAEAIEAVEAIERISRVTSRVDEIEVLFESGMRSALDIASAPRRLFIDVYAEALGGRPQAARVHAQAQQQAAASKMVAIRIEQAVQHAPMVLGAAPDSLKGAPDARTLFQASQGFCDCDHCGSVYSPAAYYVDLLRYLDVARADRLAQLTRKLETRTDPAAVGRITRQLVARSPLDVLLTRRPDLAELPLTCENTLTTLPY
ncbi:MAG: hypothetical protein ABL982_21325, partial [Vicinamibacterales bacterium]